MKEKQAELSRAKAELDRLHMEEAELTSQYDKSRSEITVLDEKIRGVEEEADKVHAVISFLFRLSYA